MIAWSGASRRTCAIAVASVLERSLVVVALGAERPGQPPHERGCVPRRVADRLVRPAVQGGGPLRGDHQLGLPAAHGLADPQVEDRHLVERVDADHQDRVGVVEVRDLRSQLGPRELAEQAGVHRARRGVDVRGAALAQDPLGQPALLVGGPAAEERGRLLAGVPQPVRHPLDRLVPADRAEAAVAGPDHRPRDPVRGVEHLEGEAALVAEPAVVDLGVVAGQDPQHPLVADCELDVALARAERADRAGVLDVPGPRAEAVGVGGQRAYWAELGDVAVERRDVRPLVEGAYEGLVAALEQLQLLVLGHLLAEADAAVAEDAALAVDRHQRRELERFLEVALGIGEPALARAPSHRDVLERALAALVADRTVERVVDEQELDDRVLCLLHPVGLRVDDHPVADRCGARGLQLRHPLDLHQAHPAGPHRIAELRLVTEDRDLDIALLGGIDEHRPLGRRHLAAVDHQRNVIADRPGHLNRHLLQPITGRAVARPRISGGAG